MSCEKSSFFNTTSSSICTTSSSILPQQEGEINEQCTDFDKNMSIKAHTGDNKPITSEDQGEICENNIQKEKKILQCQECCKIFKDNNFMFKCNGCEKDLCFNCHQTALKYGKEYRHKSNFSLCDDCCWWEIS